MSHDPGIFPNVSHDEYHKMTDIVSNSYLGRLDKCPAAAKVPMEDTPALLFGRVLHSYILDGLKGFTASFIMVDPMPTKPTKRSAEKTITAYAEWQKTLNGMTAISIEDYNTLGEMYGAIATHPIASKLLMEGRSEMSVFWTDEKTGLPCKCRPDRIPDGDHGVILDLKSVRSADIHAFTRAVMEYGYAREAGMYIEGFNAVSNAKIDAFVFICVEKEAPFRTEVYTLEDLFIEYGKQEFRRLIEIEAECRKRGYWPNYKNDGIRQLYLPNWAGGSL